MLATSKGLKEAFTIIKFAGESISSSKAKRVRDARKIHGNTLKAFKEKQEGQDFYSSMLKQCYIRMYYKVLLKFEKEYVRYVQQHHAWLMLSN